MVTGHCVTTVGKLFTPTVPRGAEGWINQLTPGIAGTSVATQPFVFNWWINRVPSGIRVEDAASARWQVTLCNRVSHAGSRSGVVLLAQTAILLYLTFYMSIVMKRINQVIVIMI